MREYILLICLCASLLTACGESESPHVSAVPQEITIAQYGHVFLYLPLYVAKSKGYFQEQGLKVKLVSTGGDEKTFAAVASGSAQFGVADPVFTAIAREQGKGGKVIALLVNGVPFWGVTFKEELNTINEPSDFSGLRIATYPAPSTNYAVMSETLLNGTNKVDATIIQGAFGTLLAMLQSDKADIAMELEPIASIAVSNGGRVVYSAAKKFGDFAFTGITVTDEYLADNPNQVNAVVKAIAKAMAFIQNDYEGALAIAKSEFGDVPEQALNNALKRILQDNVIPKTPILEEHSWNKSVTLRRQLGDINGPATFSDNVDMSFAKQTIE